MLGGLAAPEGSSHPVESILPPRHTGTLGSSNYWGGGGYANYADFRYYYFSSVIVSKQMQWPLFTNVCM